MNSKLLVLVALLAAGSLLLFFVFRTDGRERAADRVGPGPARVEGAAAGPTALEPATAPERDEEAPVEPRPAAREVAETRAGESAPAVWPEGETRWIEARVHLPEKTPEGERASVLVLAETDDYGDLYGRDGPAAELRAGRPATEIDGVLGAAAADDGGLARIGVGPGVEEAWLIVIGNYVYSHEPRRVALGESPTAVELRPELGAWISGRVTAPGADVELAGTEIQLEPALGTRLSLGGAGGESLDLRADVDAEGRFEFRSVPVGKTLTLSTRDAPLARAFEEDLEAAPGEHREVELALVAGGTIRGRVVDGEDQPVAGARVRALGKELLGNPTERLGETETDDTGLFELEHVAPGRTWMLVEKDGFPDRLTGSFELADGEVHEHGDVQLDSGQSIAGSVLFDDGSPAAGAKVSVSPDLGENVSGGPMDPRAFIGAGNEDEAAADGSFEIAGIGDGPWVVTARLDAEEGGDAPAPGRWSATRSLVHAPAESVVLTLEPPVGVSGRVLDATDSPVPAFSIHAERSGSQWYMPPSEERSEDYEDADGRFVLSDLRSGDWTFVAKAEGFADSEEIALTLPSDETLDFVLLRPVRLSGKVVDPEGRPVAGSEVGKELQGTEVFEAMQGRGDWPVAVTDDQGAFVLDELAPGAGSIVARKDGLAASEPVSYELAEGEQMEDIVLALRNGGTITGEVFDSAGEPAAGCVIILQMPTLEERRFANADGDGTFEERGLKPGMWQIQAFPGIESLQPEEGESLDQAALLAALEMTTVELADEATEHVVLGAPPADPVRVHGTVTLDGDPVGGLVVSFVPAGGGGLELLKIEPVGEDGTYELTLDEPGDYLVTVQTSATTGRQNSLEYRRTIPTGEDFQLDFALPLGRISGRVTSSDGKPLAGARVTLNIEGGLVFGTVFGGHYNETRTEEDGTYDLPYLRPGTYAIAAGGVAFGGIFGKSQGMGRVVRTTEVGEGEQVRDLDFRLEQPGTIRGTVRDASGKLVAGASIFVRDEEGHLVELFSLAQTNASGSFEYPGLAPGNYTVTARSATLAAPPSAPVCVRSGETSEVTVQLEPGTVLIVTLTDESGRDVPSRVSVLDEAGREMNGMIGLPELMERYSGGMGSPDQRVGPLPPGHYKVRADTEDGRSTRRSVTLSGKPERKVRLRLD